MTIATPALALTGELTKEKFWIVMPPAAGTGAATVVAAAFVAGVAAVVGAAFVVDAEVVAGAAVVVTLVVTVPFFVVVPLLVVVTFFTGFVVFEAAMALPPPSGPKDSASKRAATDFVFLDMRTRFRRRAGMTLGGDHMPFCGGLRVRLAGAGSCGRSSSDGGGNEALGCRSDSAARGETAASTNHLLEVIDARRSERSARPPQRRGSAQSAPERILRTMSRRLRQLDELRDLCRAGDVARAVDLAFEHVADYGLDDDVRAALSGAVERTEAPDQVRRRFAELRARQSEQDTEPDR